MKKSLIIVIVLAIVILGGFILLSKSEPVVKQNLDEARVKATEAQLKAFVSATLADMMKYYFEEKKTEPYAENSAKKQMLQAKLADMNTKNQGNYEYRIYDEDEASVKAAETSSGIYVCTDSRNITVVNINKEDFSKPTDCSGKSLKQ